MRNYLNITETEYDILEIEHIIEQIIDYNLIETKEINDVYGNLKCSVEVELKT